MASLSAPPEPEASDLTAAWLVVEREAGDYPALTAHAGIWLVAIGLSRFERAWAAIRAATAGRAAWAECAGGAGADLSVATRLEWRRLVIEVTTEEARDEADVWRVRQAIRALGIAAAMTFLPNPSQWPVAPARAQPRSQSFLV